MKFLVLTVNFILLTILQCAIAQEGGQCHNSVITPRHFFNMSQFVGDWYIQEYAVTDSEAVRPPPFKCLAVNITATSNPYNYITKETYFNTSNSNDPFPVEHSDILIIDNIRLHAYWQRTYYTSGGTQFTDSVILHTDYENWMVEYGCTMRGNYRHEVIAYWTRNRDFLGDETLKTFLRTLLIGYGMPEANRISVDQTNC